MISVVIPCYNAERTIAATIDSALVQNVDKEIIVVNDGSKDGSQEVIDGYAGRIRSHTTENRGVSAARTTGFAMAQGDFIQFVDSDDLLEPDTLAARLAALEGSGADVAHTDWRKFTSRDGRELELADVISANLAALADDPEAATATSQFWAPPVALLYRRSVVEQLTWHALLPIIQDARFLFDAAASGARFVHVSGIGALYRISANSLSHSNAQRFLDDCAVNAQEIEEIWRARGALDARRRAALADMWVHVALGRLMNGLAGFEAARLQYNRFGARNLRIELGRVARAFLGSTRAVRLFAIARSLKASIAS